MKCKQPLLRNGAFEINVVRDCGADKTGKIDATPYFQAAADTVGGRRQQGIVRVPSGTFLFKQQPGFNNPTIKLKSSTSIVASSGTHLLSEVGPGGNYGYNTCLFVNEAAVTGNPWTQVNHDISFLGGTYRVASPPALVTADDAKIGSKDITVRIDTRAITDGMGFAVKHGTLVTTYIVVAKKEVAASKFQLTLNQPLKSSLVTGHKMAVGWTGAPFFCMTNVRGFKLGGDGALKVRLLDVEGGRDPQAPWYGFRAILSVTNFTVKNVEIGYVYKLKEPGLTAKDFATEDGLHFYGPTINGDIEQVYGVSGDDFLAFDAHGTLTGVEGGEQSNMRLIPNLGRRIYDVRIKRIDAHSKWAQALRIITSTDNAVVSNFRITDYKGTANSLGGNDAAGLFIGGEIGMDCPPYILDVRITRMALNCEKTDGACVRIDGGKDIAASGVTIKPGKKGVEVTQSLGPIIINGKDESRRVDDKCVDRRPIPAPH